MDAFHGILLDLWREACRHIEIGSSCSTIAHMLERHLPLDQLIVRRFDPERAALETVAVGRAGEGEPVQAAPLQLTPEEVAQLRIWAARGEVLLRAAGDRGGAMAALAIPAEVEGEALVGPLAHEGAPMGVLILVAPTGRRLDPRHGEMMRVLLEPFSVALENDWRLREMAALREAAEADRRSLLSRLGRKDLGDVIIGVDNGLNAVMERVALVAQSDVPVLILGETGTGKELIARAIHRRSRRASGPIIRVNCGAIPPELIDSQLFGHERGAFTGAVERRKGWFERANGGTLFLDEVGELTLAAQVRLLRILQDGWLERIGGHESIKVDVRIVAATHADLAAMVAEGRFRQDLWYRIAVFPILLPPLRERVQDIPLLARHFAERAAIRYGLPVLMPTDQDIALLAAYTWPGNVRELGTVLDRAALLGNGRSLEVDKALGVLGPGVTVPAPHRDLPAAAPSAPAGGPILPLDEAMRRHIEATLAYTQGRIEGPHGAARFLGINPHTLRARMRKLGITWSQFR